MAGRGQWRNWYEFLFSVIGCLVGLGNIWRFPYLCFKNGGGAFLVPYFTFMFLCAIPLFFLEMSYAQFSNLGPGRAWICVPLFRGLGYGMVLLTAIVAIYYTVIMAWALYYLVMSFSATLPWSHCDNTFNTPSCYSRIINTNTNGNNISYSANSSLTMNGTVKAMVAMVTSSQNGSVVKKMTPTEQFWEYNVLEITGGVEEPGYIRWQLLLCLFGAWVIVFLCLIKGIKSSGLVMYVAATVPYLLLTVLLIRGATLEGAKEGLLYYLVPKWEKLLSFSVWGEAAVQVFYSAGMGWGGISTLASYNSFHNNIARDAILLPVLDCLTSWFAGCVIFLNLGHMAHVTGLHIGEVVKQGPGIAFMVYPEALAQLPLPQLWSVLFFIMLFIVGLDSQMVHVQTITCAIIDTFPRSLIKRKLLVTAATCLVLFVLGISCITQGGIYFLQILDWYCASVSVMLLALLEVIGLAWLYGLRRLYADLELMLGRKVSRVWGVFWQYITPVIIVLIWIFNLTQLKPVKYGKVTYPDWAIGLGWVIAFISIIPIPTFIVKKLFELDGSFIERVRQSIVPSPEWEPADDDVKEQYRRMNDPYELQEKI